MHEFLDFFAVEDWFGRPGPYGFNTERIIFVIISVFLCCFIPIKLKGRKNAERKALVSLWIFALILDVIKYIFYNAYCLKNNLSIDKFEFPLWTCTIFLIVLPLSLFLKNEKVKQACNAFLCSISFVGGIINFLFPSESLFSFMGLHTFLYHFVLTIVPIIMLVTGYYKPKFNHCLGAILIFVIYAIPVFVIDNIFALDYMFIYDGSWFGPMSEFAVLMPHRLVWTLICVVGHALVAMLIILIEDLLITKGQSSSIRNDDMSAS